MKNDVPKQLQVLLADIFDVEEHIITQELKVGDIEQWDSFSHLQAILAMELEFGIHFDSQKIPKLISVSNLIDELVANGITIN